ncbi:MAG TPA: hypothetical protein VJN90_09180 [Candidatus Acidoferrales bacterium]|nr:hypothetical protein [Candidatus Acidoferrales bacterium]
MKNCHRVLLAPLFVAVALSLAATQARAQDPVKVAPTHFKVLLENDHVRVLDFRCKAGDKIPMHSHPNYITYSISGGAGNTKFTSPDGKVTERANKGGQAVWHEAETHSSESSVAIHVLIVEFKQ